jgi:serine/threonine protein kinase
MGVVWQARQLSTRRNVALKVMGAGSFASDRARQRFEREVELAAGLEHPNIARVYESGLCRGVYYYAMEWVHGVDLAEYVAAYHLSRQQVLELMRAVCLAVQHAHQRGVIHRDLKPSNILVSEDGQPHVLDFGVAKALRSAAEPGLSGSKPPAAKVTEEGEMTGTPTYMSPEQAAGTGAADTRSDVYSLGGILFELLTGESPHDLSGTRYEVLRRIAEEEVRRPSQSGRSVDPELEALLLKTLAHDPEKRYATAGELAQDIDNYLKGEPLTARPPTMAYFLLKRMRRYRVQVSVAGAVAAALFGMAVHHPSPTGIQ